MHLQHREQEIDLIIRELARAFGDRVVDERIASEVRRAYDELCATAKVKTFIPILALRRARERVRLLAEPADAGPASVEVLAVSAVLPVSRARPEEWFTVSGAPSA